MSFENYRDELIAHYTKNMSRRTLLRTEVSGDELWEAYLAAFHPKDNPMFRQRTEHDCSACKRFIRVAGNMVAGTREGELVSLWDFVPSDEKYAQVNIRLSALVKNRLIASVFMHNERCAGTKSTPEFNTEINAIMTWNHLYLELPPHVLEFDKNSLQAKVAKHSESAKMFFRAITEIHEDALTEAIDLIKQGSLYRGEEHLPLLEKFLELKKLWIVTDNGRKSELLVWRNALMSPVLARIRNSVIGTLLVDLSEGKDLEEAVKAYEVKVAPNNYKRPKSLVTKAMVNLAQKTVEELGYMTALSRRHARVEDLTVNNVLFVDRETRKVMDPLQALAAELPVTNAKNLGRLEEIPVEKFMSEVLPTVTTMEVLFENVHAGNLVSLIAPQDPESKIMFKWDNNFSWSYAGEVADSIKERVKNAGGQVDGVLRASLSWSNHDDLDLSIKEPNGNLIFFGQKRGYATGGNLDVDMNASRLVRNPVENIIYPAKDKLLGGLYEIWVHQYTRRENIDVGFEVEIDMNGELFVFGFPDAVAQSQRILVATIAYDKKKGTFEMRPALSATSAQRTHWNIKTGTFHKVKMVTLSPNHWDDQASGNRHWFFMLDGCATDTVARGFFNEFLKPELHQHRKVFEVLGSRMSVVAVPEQLSGLGFSSTKRAALTVKLGGSFNRIVKILF